MKHIQDDLNKTDELNLRSAFSPVPTDIRDMLVRTANSVKEEEKVRKYKPVAVLMAALIVFATMSVGLAASELVGWTDFFSRFYGGSIPKQMQNAMKDAEHTTFTLGPIAFTVQEALCDGKVIMTSVLANTADGSAAIMAPDGEAEMSISANYDTELTRLNLKKGTSWLEAARQKNLPIYTVRATPEVPYDLHASEQYEDFLHDAEGNMIYFSGLPLKDEKVGDELPIDFYLSVYELDPDTGDVIQTWTDRPEYTVAVNRNVLNEKTYTPEEEITVAGCKLENVRMELRVTGAYVYTTFIASDSVDYDSDEWLTACYRVQLTDQDGNRLPNGVSLSYGRDASAWPTVVFDETTMIDALPDVIGAKLTYDAEEVYLLK